MIYEDDAWYDLDQLAEEVRVPRTKLLKACRAAGVEPIKGRRVAGGANHSRIGRNTRTARCYSIRGRYVPAVLESLEYLAREAAFAKPFSTPGMGPLLALAKQAAARPERARQTVQGIKDTALQNRWSSFLGREHRPEDVAWKQETVAGVALVARLMIDEWGLQGDTKTLLEVWASQAPRPMGPKNPKEGPSL